MEKEKTDSTPYTRVCIESVGRIAPHIRNVSYFSLLVNYANGMYPKE
jgi:hypothetical protein